MTDPTSPVDRDPLAPVATDDPSERDPLLLAAPDGGGPASPIADALENLASDVVDGNAAAVSADDVGHAFGLRDPLGGSLGELARTAGKAVQEFAFPLTLAIAVLLFLLFQGELDRRDPKLAFAPVDSTKDMVSFE
ncbi:MAG: hypothetical protein M3271_01160 [Actinomycetota bacterium]|nr:hypothetical protein [Actinomycetota bacterium]